MVIQNDGSVGIGYGATYDGSIPNFTNGYKFSVNGSASIKKTLRVTDDTQYGGYLQIINSSKTENSQINKWQVFNMTGDKGNGLQIWGYNTIPCGEPGSICNPFFTIQDNGYVGIGTARPGYKLTVAGSAAIQGDMHASRLVVNGPIHAFSLTDNFSYDNKSIGHYSQGWHWDSWQTGAPTMYLSGAGGVKMFTNGQLRMGIDSQGNTMISGLLKANEIQVKADVWSDFVFEDDYQLKSLEDVEAFIKENKHLPDVPSAKQVMESGINIAEMDAILLQKIEELTLIVIDQHKTMQEMQRKIELLETK